MAGFTVKVTPPNLKGIPAKLSARVNKRKNKAMTAVALAGVTMIEKRTAKGKSYTGSPFKKYTPEYAEYRAAAGRNATPNLEFTGQMLGSLTAKANKRKGIIFFARASEGKKAAFNNRSRPFMGFTKGETSDLAAIYKRKLMPKGWNK